MGGSRPSGCCRRPGRLATRARHATSGGRWPRPKRAGRSSGGPTGRGYRRPASTSSLIGPKRPGGTCCAPSWPGVVCGSSASVPTRRGPPRWRCWPSVSTSWAACRRRCSAIAWGCLKAGVVANVVVPHPEYVAFATRFGFRPDFCEAADPESKGLVENLCGYVQRDLLVPALLEQDWPDEEVANAAARAWCAEVNGQIHSEIAAVPAERLVNER